MKRIKFNPLLVLLLILSLLTTDLAFAQFDSGGIGFEDGMDDEGQPEASINSLIFLAMITGGFLGIRKLKE